MINQEVLRADLDTLRHGGAEAISLFMDVSARLHRSDDKDALRQWIILASPALPELERGNVILMLMRAFITIYELEPTDNVEVSVH